MKTEREWSGELGVFDEGSIERLSEVELYFFWDSTTSMMNKIVRDVERGLSLDPNYLEHAEAARRLKRAICVKAGIEFEERESDGRIVVDSAVFNKWVNFYKRYFEDIPSWKYQAFWESRGEDGAFNPDHLPKGNWRDGK